ncbi:transmembrane protein 192-like isoform X1 [Liolophura sinensis]|uniref:transmembrane protein 192-like isoform X1 n=1 Tax=Liolophura sinensis TaxID=3198878 RepID=UPI0031595E6C
MVSLGDDSRRSGGYFFDQTDNSIQSHDSDDPLLSDHTSLSADVDPPFRQIKTTWVILLQIVLVVLLGTGSYIVPVLCQGEKCGASDFSIVAYAHGGLWIVFTAIDRYLRYHHYVSRTLGYLEFYRQTRHVRRLPVTVHSGANAALVVVLIALENFCDVKAQTCGKLKRDNYLQILITLEVAVILPILILYLVRTVKFNRKSASPDVQQDEMMTSFLSVQVVINRNRL